MTPFKWGKFSQLVDANIFDDSGLRLDQSGKSEFAAKTLSSEEGGGTFDYLHTPDFSVVAGNFAFNRDKEFSTIDDGRVRFHVCFDLTTQVSMRGVSLPGIVENAAGLLVAGSNEPMVERMPAYKQQTFVSIACRPQWLDDSFGFRLAEHLTSRACGPEFARDYSINFSAQLSSAAMELNRFRPPGRLRAAFVSAKAQEIVVRALGELRTMPPEQTSALTEQDVMALQRAREILETSLAAPPSIDALSRRIGINRTKLFYGFKTLYGTSVARFIEARRMAWASRLLIKTDMSVAAIAFEVGYEHAGNFSTRFKVHFGCSPKAFRIRLTKQHLS